jgi:uncharacterized protein
MLFVDTGAFLARYLARDQHHQRAREGWRLLTDESRRLAATNFVLDETFTLLARWAGHSFAAARAREIYASGVLQIIRPDESDELGAVSLLDKYGDQGVSFTDCVSFVVMRRVHIGEAFAFDRHFELAGFALWPRS